MQPIVGAIPVATPAPGESKSIPREDGTVAAVPDIQGRTKTFHIVSREAPWTIRPGRTVMALTYNGVVPGPTLVVNQGDHVVIDFTNGLTVPDTIHMHGIDNIPTSMDGVGGISQPMVQPGGHFRYEFIAARDGTFIYHTHDRESMLNSGLYGGIIVLPTHPRAEEAAQRDDLEILSSWVIQSTSENVFTINGKAYPATRPIEVTRGQRVRIRWINISGENFHTMHTHGHVQQIIARDANPLTYLDREDTVDIGPGQRVDAIVVADATPGTWLVHCHVGDHIEDAGGMPDGLVTAIHYSGTKNDTTAMYDEMLKNGMGTMSMGGDSSAKPKLSLAQSAGLGLFAGLTIFLGLPIARAKRLKPSTIALLNAVAIGILVYLVVEIANGAVFPVVAAVKAWHVGGGTFPSALVCALLGGLLVGLVGLGSTSMQFAKRGAQIAESPLVLASMIAIGIGAHNFAEGLAIGASAASGATVVAFGLIAGFALHNATEGFGIAAPLAGRTIPSWAQLGLAGLVAGGPTFLGTVVGYQFASPLLSVFFLAIAVGALVFVIGELWSILKRTGVTAGVTAMTAAGFVIALATELLVDLNGG